METTNAMKNGRSGSLGFKGLKMKLIIFVCAMLVVIISVLAIMNYYSLSTAITSTVDDMVVPLATESAADISSSVSMLKAQCETVSLRVLTNVNIGVKMSIKPILGMHIRDSKIGCKSYVLFKEEEYYVSSDEIKEADAAEYLSQDYFIESRKKESTTISNPVVTEDGTSAEFSIAVTGKSNVTTYTLVLNFDISALSSIVETVKFGETGKAYIIDETGRTIADRDIENVLSEFNTITLAETDSTYADLAEASTLALSGESGVMLGTANGVPSRIAYAPVQDSTWAIILEAPESEFTSPMAASITTIIIFSVIMLIVTIILTFIIMSGIVNPIIGITDRLKKLSEGDLVSPVKVLRQNNEIGVLSESLEETVVSLQIYIDRISNALQDISDGNLAFDMDGSFKGDFVKIKTSFNSILADLRTTFEQINLAANQVSDGASQVSAGAQLLSVGALQQYEAVTNVSTRIDDIVMHAESNTQAAVDTGRLVSSIREQIDSCNREMEKMLASMEDITKSSAQISEIISVIDDIAFQTNILALNAAVEAARAGDAGLGFAVVADEVRNLANMSADAAKQTGELIEDSIRSVKHGMVMAKSTAASLNAVVTGAADINEHVEKISEASQQQNEVIKSIRDGVQQVTQVISNTSATAEESAAAAEEMSGQAVMLREMISKFKYQYDEPENDSDDLGDDTYQITESEHFYDSDSGYDMEYVSPEDTDDNDENVGQDNVESDEQDTDVQFESEDETPVEYSDADDHSPVEEFHPIDFKSIDDDEFLPHDGDKY